MENKMMSKIRLTETFKQRLCADIFLQIKNGHNTFYKLKKVLAEQNPKFGAREIRSALKYGCSRWILFNLKGNQYKFFLEGKTYSYKIV